MTSQRRNAKRLRVGSPGRSWQCCRRRSPTSGSRFPVLSSMTHVEHIPAPNTLVVAHKLDAAAWGLFSWIPPSPERVRYGQWRGGGTSHSLALGAKNMTKILVCSALLCTIAGGAAAQSPGTFEVGGFGRYANFGGDLRLHDRCCGAGAYIGFYFLRDLALEGEGSYLPTHDEPTQTVAVSNVPLRARLLYNIPVGPNATALQLGAGYVHDIYGKAVDFKNSGVTGFAGFRLGVASFLTLRVGGTVDYVPSPSQTGVSNYWNWGVQFGGGLMLGN